MAWQDSNNKPLSPAQVCRAVTDRTRNMNMGGTELLKHHQEAAPKALPLGSRSIPY
jgi:hypothetical protein